MQISRRRLLMSASATAAFVSTGCASSPESGTIALPPPPQHRRSVVEIERYGMHRTDAYAWMKPSDWHAVLRDPPSLGGEIKAAIDQETDYATAVMAPTAALQARLRARIEALEALGASRVEVEDGGFLYSSRASGEHRAFVRRPLAGGAEQVLLDVAAEASGPLYALAYDAPLHSADQRIVAWGADQTGSGAYRLHVREIDTGRVLLDDIDNCTGAFALDPRGQYIYWVRRNALGRPDSVWRRTIGSSENVQIHSEGDASFFIDVKAAGSGDFILIRVFNADQTEVLFIPTAEPTRAPRVIEPRTAGMSYDVTCWNGAFVILTNADGAFDYKVMTARPDAPGRAHWRELTPHQPGRYIAAVHAFAAYLVREEWRDAKPRLVIADRNGVERDIAFDDAAYAIEAPGQQGYANTAFTYIYQSFKTPKQVRRTMLATGESTTETGAADRTLFDPDRYIVERIEAAADDGALVPITIIRRRDLTGPRPLGLYGYGSYGFSLTTGFEPPVIAMVDEGWSYAFAHVRGGAERGSGWWHSVLKHGKRTTFTDFITCAEHLIANGYTERGRIVAHGMSAGGLLIGAVYTMRPDLWAGVIAQVPFVDVLNSIDDYQNHPLGETPFPIWGDPRVEEDYRYLATYSPYDALESAAYPAIFATGGVADDAVAFWEPMKFVAKARYVSTDASPKMVLVHPTAGHMGPPGAAAQREQQALFIAFAIAAEDPDRFWRAA